MLHTAFAIQLIGENYSDTVPEGRVVSPAFGFSKIALAYDGASGMPPPARADLALPVSGQTLGILASHPIALSDVALTDSVLQLCAKLDDRVLREADRLRLLRPSADLDALACAQDMDILVPGKVEPVRFPSKPTLAAALGARPNSPSCAELSAAIAGRALTPWHLRQANAAATQSRPRSFRTGFHHLAADADGIAVVFPPTDCARVLTRLCAWLNGSPPLPVVAQALIAHLQICKLHAFHDGNGRLARVLLTAILNARLVKAKELYLPLAFVIFANAELVSAEYRRATDARFLNGFVSYGGALLDRMLDAVTAAAPKQTYV